MLIAILQDAPRKREKKNTMESVVVRVAGANLGSLQPIAASKVGPRAELAPVRIDPLRQSNIAKEVSRFVDHEWCSLAILDY